MKVVATQVGYCNNRLWEPAKGDIGPFVIPDEPTHKRDNEKRGYVKGTPKAFSATWMKVAPEEVVVEVATPEDS